MENQVHFEILQVATTQKLQRFTVNQCVVICGYSAVFNETAISQTKITKAFIQILGLLPTASPKIRPDFIQKLLCNAWYVIHNTYDSIILYDLYKYFLYSSI